MMWMEKINVPNVNFMTNGEIERGRVEEAYKDLITVYGGIRDFVSIIDCVLEGRYSLSELMIAGVIITDGMEGYLRKKNYIMRGKYLKINHVNVFLRDEDNALFVGDEIAGYVFESCACIYHALFQTMKVGKEWGKKLKKEIEWLKKQKEYWKQRMKIREEGIKEDRAKIEIIQNLLNTLEGQSQTETAPKN